MSGDDGALRQFVAAPGFFGIGPKWSAGRSYGLMYGGLAVLVLPIVVIGVLNLNRHGSAGTTMARIGPKLVSVIPVVLVAFAILYALYYWSHNQKKFVISVTGDGLIVSQRPGDVYPFADTRLGLWGYDEKTMGTALHLRCGIHQFVLGGRDHRVGSQTRMDEPPVVGVDAWLWANEFDELLSMVGPGSGIDVRPPSPGESSRCLLFYNPMRVQQMGVLSGRGRYLRSLSKAQLAIDFGADGIRISEPHSNTLIASAALSQVTARPATYQFRRYRGNMRFVEQGIDRQLSETIEMIVCVPGMEDLTIACRDVAGASEVFQRFSWRGPVEQRVNDAAAYAASGADWPTLVERLGLSPYLVEQGGQQ